VKFVIDIYLVMKKIIAEDVLCAIVQGIQDFLAYVNGVIKIIFLINIFLTNV
tara:strand:+ start:44 stop:199 length:156 start_codon:yes stop_codon:yes gene_type:complete